MPEEIVDLHEAKKKLPQLVERAGAGESFVIARAGRPLARLVPIPRYRPVRIGSLRGRIRVPEDIDRVAQDEIDTMFGG